jgi:acylphosphatase
MARSQSRCVRVAVTGRVQGVWYRAWTREEARDLGLDGWVRNRPDGSVEAVLSGRNGDIEAMLQLLWSGPPLARVDSVVVEEWSESVAPGFEQRPTG